MSEKNATIKVVNASKCRRELVLDEQTYFGAEGVILKDANGRALQPRLTRVQLEQGANEVDRAAWDKLIAADKLRAKPYLKVLLAKKILRVSEIEQPTIDEKAVKDAGLTPDVIEDLSRLSINAAKKMIAACKDPATLRAWVDQDHRSGVRAALRARWEEIVPAESSGVEELEQQ